MRQPILSVLLSLSMFSASFQVYGQSLGKIEASGEAGVDARDATEDYTGQRASDGSWSGDDGSNGRHGSDAGEGTEGKKAKNIFAELSRPQQGVLRVQGYVTMGTAPNGEKFIKDVKIGNEGTLSLEANGGNGGRGGVGGGGEGGGGGASGSNATENTWGGDGGDGGRGGNPGAGTSGKDAGDAGNVETKVAEKDMSLLMLVETQVKGGKGGKVGRHGEPGSGGSAGSGGNSYSWTTQHYEGDDVTTDSEGNETSRTARYRTEYHSNPGGSSGSDGSSGTRITTPLFSGKDGKDGKAVIKVVMPDGSIKEYTQRYDLAVDFYVLVPEDKDGILEPGERVFLRSLSIKNAGGMPTPPHSKIRLYIKDSKYFVADAVELEIPKSLQPGEKFSFEGKELSFVIKNNLLAKPTTQRATWRDSVRPLSEVVDVSRHFDGFAQSREFEITYPIEIEPITTTRALAPGEKTRVMFKIKNLSHSDYGSTAAIKRSIEYLIKSTGGELTPENYEIRTLDGKRFDPTAGFLGAINTIKGKGEAIIEAEFMVGHTAEPYTSVGFNVDLIVDKGVQKGVDVEERQTLQYQPVRFSVSQTYVHRQDSRFLLVVNSETNHAAYKSWMATLASLGQQADVWDLSYYGHLELTQALSNGSSLAKDFQGKTIIILNNGFQTNQKSSAKAAQFITRQNLMHAATQAGIGALIVGGNDKEITDKLANLSFDYPSVRADSIGKFLKGERGSNTPIKDSFTDISYTSTAFIGKPNPGRLSRAAEKLQAKLDKLYPERNYQVVYVLKPELMRKGFLGMGAKWNLGTVEIHRTLDTNQPSIVNYDISAEDMLRPEVIESREMLYSIMLALPFDTKLEVLQEVIKKGITTDHVMAIFDAIETDLVIEQGTMRKSKWSFSLSEKEIEAKMVKLKKFADLKLQLGKDAPRATKIQALKVLAAIENLSSQATRWWDYILPNRTNLFVTDVTKRHLKTARENFIVESGWFGIISQNAHKSGEIKALLKRAQQIATETDPSKKQATTQVVNTQITSSVMDAKDASKSRTQDKRNTEIVKGFTNQILEDRAQLSTASTAHFGAVSCKAAAGK